MAGQEDVCLGQGTRSWRLRVPRSLLMPGRMVVPLGIVFATDLSRHLFYMANNPDLGCEGVLENNDRERRRV